MKLTYLNSNKKNFISKLEIILNRRREQDSRKYLLVKNVSHPG